MTSNRANNSIRNLMKKVYFDLTILISNVPNINGLSLLIHFFLAVFQTEFTPGSD